MMYMLDTNIIIYAIKHKPTVVFEQLKAHLSDGLCISAITLAELEHGVQKSAYPMKNAAALLRLLSIIDVLPFDDQAAVEYGNICAYLQKQGTPIGTMDMLIAGHARAQGLILVTNNVREFQRVPELKIENWTIESPLHK